jgi:formamidopyrimidine-DNA glycosylase
MEAAVFGGAGNARVRCQTGGKLLADRALSRLLGADWPRTMDELEALKKL